MKFWAVTKPISHLSLKLFCSLNILIGHACNLSKERVWRDILSSSYLTFYEIQTSWLRNIQYRSENFILTSSHMFFFLSIVLVALFSFTHTRLTFYHLTTLPYDDFKCSLWKYLKTVKCSANSFGLHNIIQDLDIGEWKLKYLRNRANSQPLESGCSKVQNKGTILFLMLVPKYTLHQL